MISKALSEAAVRFKLLLSITVLLIPSVVLADDLQQGVKAVLHVTSVKQEEAPDWCTAGKCLATRFVVEGYRAAKTPNEVIRYVLECVEVMTTPDGKITVACVRVQADEDYEVRMLADAIVFQTTEPPKDGAVRSAYGIKSQREEKK